MIKIITDSTCNLPAHILEEHDIRVAPIAIQFGGESFEEGINIDRKLFYRKIEELRMIPTTSQPSPVWFSRFYDEVTKLGHSVLAITITSQHSGTFTSAQLAKSLAPSADVEVFDSKTISLGTGWMVLEAARAAEAGWDRLAILRRLQEIRDRARLFLTPSTLKYLQMSGRVGKLQGVLASALNIKPIIFVRDGTLQVGERIRTRARALRRLVELIAEAVGTSEPVNVAVIHAQVPDEGQELLAAAGKVLNCAETMLEDLVPSLAVHGGPGVVGLFAYRT